MKAISATVFVLCLIVAYLAYTQIIEPVQKQLEKANRFEKVEEQLQREIDMASEEMRTLIQHQQSRLPQKYVFAEPPFYYSDLPARVKYLRWQIGASIALQRIQSGKPIGDVPGMSIGSPAPVGSSNR